MRPARKPFAPALRFDKHEAVVTKVQLGQVEVNYQLAGSGEPVVLVPGFATSLHLWDNQVAPLSRRYRCLSYDMRGQGESSAPREGYSTEDHAEDLRLLLEHLNLPRAHLVAASMGGAVAVHFALERPELVRSLTLAGAVVDGFEGWEDEYGLRLRRARKIAQTEGVEAALKDWMGHPFFGATRDLADFGRRVVRYSGAGWLTSVRPPKAPRSDFSRLSEIEKPVLVVVGEKDVDACRAIAEELRKRIPKARAAVIKSAGHLPCWDRPEEFNRVLLEFLEGQHAQARPNATRA